MLQFWASKTACRQVYSKCGTVDNRAVSDYWSSSVQCRYWRQASRCGTVWFGLNLIEVDHRGQMIKTKIWFDWPMQANVWGKISKVKGREVSAETLKKLSKFRPAWNTQAQHKYIDTKGMAHTFFQATKVKFWLDCHLAKTIQFLAIKNFLVLVVCISKTVGIVGRWEWGRAVAWLVWVLYAAISQYIHTWHWSHFSPAVFMSESQRHFPVLQSHTLSLV